MAAYPAAMVEAMRATLAATPGRRISARGRARAAVLVGVVAGRSPRLLLIERSDTVVHHRGEIAFPGGRMEATDRDLWRCCLREAEEEVGLAAAAVELLGRLDDLVTSSGFVVSPFVGVIDKLPKLVAARREVKRCFTPAAAPLLSRAAWTLHPVWDGSGLRPIYALASGRPPIWGATAAILVDLARRLDPPPAAGAGVAEVVAPGGGSVYRPRAEQVPEPVARVAPTTAGAGVAEVVAPYGCAAHRPLAERAPELVARLLAWYRPRGRDLPWRRTRDPYRVWLSEIMLQQTRVETVLPYYDRFLARLPSLAALATADEDEVLGLWEGLGYYRRARHLHAAARAMVAHGVPADSAGWARLPGVGRSTAGAIAAICFGERAPVLDGNVQRVLARLLALRLAPATPMGGRILWSCATHLTPATETATYTQAIMELGATCCTPRRPDCATCPWAPACGGRALDWVAELPARTRRAPLPHHREVAVVVRRGDRLLLRRRPDGTLLAGLWAFPHTRVVGGEGEGAAARRLAAQLLGRPSPPLAPLTRLEHAYTHFRITLHAFFLDPGGEPAAAAGEWVALAALDTRPMAVTDRAVARAAAAAFG
ncbi:MAG: hypothetical protein COZ33_03930 [Nitrospirae bacterium CG_4_10_14_3_um_filter_70_108]|nr:MAG: hypothetical protein COZ33_03930 [Nitrospirae bacterium CG_4_10_14_3_um_filter_70_108]PJB94967.1 MAG: hypothetical protein CO080_10135 [Nitrospirae bacterium CG_4_9_14_0_8_um_filter_70_14]